MGARRPGSLIPCSCSSPTRLLIRQASCGAWAGTAACWGAARGPTPRPSGRWPSPACGSSSPASSFNTCTPSSPAWPVSGSPVCWLLLALLGAARAPPTGRKGRPRAAAVGGRLAAPGPSPCHPAPTSAQPKRRRPALAATSTRSCFAQIFHYLPPIPCFLPSLRLHARAAAGGQHHTARPRL